MLTLTQLIEAAAMKVPWVVEDYDVATYNKLKPKDKELKAALKAILDAVWKPEKAGTKDVAFAARQFEELGAVSGSWDALLGALSEVMHVEYEVPKSKAVWLAAFKGSKALLKIKNTLAKATAVAVGELNKSKNPVWKIVKKLVGTSAEYGEAGKNFLITVYYSDLTVKDVKLALETMGYTGKLAFQTKGDKIIISGPIPAGDKVFKSAKKPSKKELSKPGKKVTTTVKQYKFIPSSPGSKWGKVWIGNKEWTAVTNNHGQVWVQSLRFKVGDKIVTHKGEVNTVADIKWENKWGTKLPRYVFSNGGWSRDLFPDGSMPGLMLAGKADAKEVEKAQAKLDEVNQKHKQHLETKKAFKGAKLQKLVDDGTLYVGMKVKIKAKYGMDEAIIKAFNFVTGKIRVQRLKGLVSQLLGKSDMVWVTRVWFPGGFWSVT